MNTQTDNVQVDKPKNRNHFVIANGITLDSMFPSGNIGYARMSFSKPFTIEIKGNPDYSTDPTARYWLYFRMKGYRRGMSIIFNLKQANHLRKFYNSQRGNKPTIVFKTSLQQDKWSTIQTELQINALQQNKIQGQFQFYVPVDITDNTDTTRFQTQTQTSNYSKKNQIDEVYIAINYPYSEEDLEKYLIVKKEQYSKIQKSISNVKSDSCQKEINQLPYFNEETLTYSIQRRRISIVTITSSQNIQTMQQRQPRIHQNLFPYIKERPFKLKKAPVILITGRVHPSQVSASFFIEGIIDFLLLKDNQTSRMLRKLFIFVIVPMINPDGVSNGNYRHDNNLRNLNRFYGKSTFEQTPQIKALQYLINYYKGQSDLETCSRMGPNTSNRLVFYFDVHGHQSQRSSFLFGNFTQNVSHMVQNKLLCKLIEKNFIKNGFKNSECDFSKKNMTVKQKYDQNSKLHSGRAFTGSQFQNSNENAKVDCVFHSYTLQVSPFCPTVRKNNVRNSNKNQKLFYLNEYQDLIQQSQISQLPDYCKALAQSILKSILQITGINEDKQQQKQIWDLRAFSFRQTIQQLIKLKNSTANIKKYDKMIADIKLFYKMFQNQEFSFLNKYYYQTMFSDNQFKKSKSYDQVFKDLKIAKIFIPKQAEKSQGRRISYDLGRHIIKASSSRRMITLDSLNLSRKQTQQERASNISKKTLGNKLQQLQECKQSWDTIRKIAHQQSKIQKTQIHQYQNQFMSKIKGNKIHKISQVNIGQTQDILFSQQKQDVIHCNRQRNKKVGYRIKTQNYVTSTSSDFDQQGTGFTLMEKPLFQRKHAHHVQNRILTQGKQLDVINQNPITNYVDKIFSIKAMTQFNIKQPRQNVYSSSEIYKPRNSYAQKSKYTIDVQSRSKREQQDEKNDSKRCLPMLHVHQTPKTFIKREYQKSRRDPTQRKTQGKTSFIKIQHSSFSKNNLRDSNLSKNDAGKQYGYLKAAKQMLRSKRVQMLELEKLKKNQIQAQHSRDRSKFSYPKVFKVDKHKNPKK